MTDAFSFGSYWPGDSPLHRMDPRAKLALGLCFLIVSLVGQAPVALAVLALFVVALYRVAGIPAGRALRSLAPMLPIVVLVCVLRLFTDQAGETLWLWGVFQISEGSLRSCLSTVVRLTAMMAGMSLVTLTTTALDLTTAFEHLLAPLARVGVPAHELGMMLGIALRFMPQLAEEMRATYAAQVSRGARLSGSPLRGVRALSSVAVPMFASVFRHAETLAAAMDARCYHGEQGRTKLHPLRLARRDAVGCAVMVVLLAVVVAANVLAG